MMHNVLVHVQVQNTLLMTLQLLDLHSLKSVAHSLWFKPVFVIAWQVTLLLWLQVETAARDSLNVWTFGLFGSGYVCEVFMFRECRL